MYTILIISAIAIFCILQLLSSKREVEVKIAYAGTANGKPTVERLPAERNNTIFTEGEKVVDLSGYDTFIISGDSLVKVGLYPGTKVYTLPFGNQYKKSISGKFVILRYDLVRQEREHPDIRVTEDSYKARKAVKFIKNCLPESDFKELVSDILSKDSEIENKEKLLRNLWIKYKFASDFYPDEESLMMSMTYKKGEGKTYSFHSPKFIAGVVEYKSV